MNANAIKCVFVLLVAASIIAVVVWNRREELYNNQLPDAGAYDKAFISPTKSGRSAQKAKPIIRRIHTTRKNNETTSRMNATITATATIPKKKQPNMTIFPAPIITTTTTKKDEPNNNNNVNNKNNNDNNTNKTQPTIKKVPAPTTTKKDETKNHIDSTSNNNNNNNNKKRPVIAYAVSITSYESGNFKSGLLYDNAAVLHQSIKRACSQPSSKYDYKMIAFIHTDAAVCANGMKKLGYEVQIRDTPFNETEIRNPVLRDVQVNGCCGSKEYLKLYAYTLVEYPIVVHVDLDTIILKPMDPMFDLMLLQEPSLSSSNFNRSNIPAMWLSPEDFPKTIDFVYTRDYNMVDPPARLPHQMGVQGGFLVIRPNMTDFDRMVEIILSGGDFVAGVGWGGQKLKYGGYYGAGTIQGLASYYYGEFAKNRSLELNRCYYNTMVDDPKNTIIVKNRPKVKLQCRTLEEECQDCRKTPLNEIYNAHFTVCGKPHYCVTPKGWWLPGMEDHHSLCMELFQQWHLARRSLEEEWELKYPNSYNPNFAPLNLSIAEEARMFNYTQGHCQKRRYIPMEYPAGFLDNSTDLPRMIE